MYNNDLPCFASSLFVKCLFYFTARYNYLLHPGGCFGNNETRNGKILTYIENV